MRSTAKTADNAHNSAQQRHSARQTHGISTHTPSTDAAQRTSGGKGAMLAGTPNKVLPEVNSEKLRSAILKPNTYTH
jgi:hypothetical protein